MLPMCNNLVGETIAESRAGGEKQSDFVKQLAGKSSAKCTVYCEVANKRERELRGTVSLNFKDLIDVLSCLPAIVSALRVRRRN